MNIYLVILPVIKAVAPVYIIGGGINTPMLRRLGGLLALNLLDFSPPEAVAGCCRALPATLAGLDWLARRD